MTTEEKREALRDHCAEIDCRKCSLQGSAFPCGRGVRVTEMDDGLISRPYDLVFPAEPESPRILDSGHRREFETGAVRDIQEGKGRCDLLPLDVIASIYDHKSPNLGRCAVLHEIARYVRTGDYIMLYDAIEQFMLKDVPFGDCNWSTIFLEVSKHFEEGCKKYGENNWQKGIPTHCYIDSAVRHYLKWARGDKDEPHDRAFCWNILCCIWTCIHKPELNDYAKEKQDEKPV